MSINKRIDGCVGHEESVGVRKDLHGWSLQRSLVKQKVMGSFSVYQTERHLGFQLTPLVPLSLFMFFSVFLNAISEPR